MQLVQNSLRPGVKLLLKILKRISRTSEVSEPRNTDRDWQIIGETEPYFGVITHEEFKRENLTESARSDFYNTGRRHIDADLVEMRRLFGNFVPKSALDFGCGVGRLTVPLAEVTGDAVGVDISPGMLAEARKNGVPGLQFLEQIPDRKFDWIISHTVLQHIPSERGYLILRDLLSRVAEGGGAIIQLTFARASEHADSVGVRVIQGSRGAYYPPTRPNQPNIPEGTMTMHDYDLSIVIAEFYAAGMKSLHLQHTDHGGMIGAAIYARKGSV